MGLSILESYSRVVESLAHTVMTRIKDVLYANSLVRTDRNQSEDFTTPSPTLGSAAALTLSDFISLNSEKEMWKSGEKESYKGEEENIMIIREISSVKRFSYIDKVEMVGFRSPARG